MIKTPLKLVVGSILIENPVDCYNKCTENGITPWWSTTLRSYQARVFSVITGNNYQHVLQYIGDGKVIHTRQGKVGVDMLDNFAPKFYESCAIAYPNIDVILDTLTKNNIINLEYEISKRSSLILDSDVDIKQEIWSDIFKNNILPIYMKNIGQHTDVFGIILTPLYRYTATSNSECTKQTLKSSYSCTGLISRVWAAAGIILFPELHLDAIYPEDFLRCKYFSKLM